MLQQYIKAAGLRRGRESSLWDLDQLLLHAQLHAAEMCLRAAGLSVRKHVRVLLGKGQFPNASVP